MILYMYKTHDLGINLAMQQGKADMKSTAEVINSKSREILLWFVKIFKSWSFNEKHDDSHIFCKEEIFILVFFYMFYSLTKKNRNCNLNVILLIILWPCLKKYLESLVL